MTPWMTSHHFKKRPLWSKSVCSDTKWGKSAFRSSPAPCFNQRRWAGQTYHALSLVRFWYAGGHVYVFTHQWAASICLGESAVWKFDVSKEVCKNLNPSDVAQSQNLRMAVNQELFHYRTYKSIVTFNTKSCPRRREYSLKKKYPVHYKRTSMFSLDVHPYWFVMDQCNMIPESVKHVTSMWW